MRDAMARKQSWELREGDESGAAACACYAAGFSTTVARPWPTPMHIVASP
jgi:hypothetical protein